MPLKQTVEQMRFGGIGDWISKAFQPSEIPRRRLLVLCFIVFTVAFGVRLLHWQNNWLTIDNLMDKTAARYQEEAQFLTDRDFTSFIRGRSQEPDTGMLIHTPGYPIFVAAVHALSRNSNVALRLIHITSGAAAVVLVLLIALELLPTGVAILAALFAAVSPQLSFYSLVLLPDSVIGITLLLGMYLLVRARRQQNHLMIIGAGVCIGLSCWLRANVLVLAPFLCLFIPLLFPRDKWLRYAVLLVTAAVLTIMPITIRNAVVFKSFIPLTLGTGTNLMEGIADYDPEKRFAMEQHYHLVAQNVAAI
jgi:4-amino-4-deoxy-L-arabinose transferase-like glycosyltransferase